VTETTIRETNIFSPAFSLFTAENIFPQGDIRSAINGIHSSVDYEVHCWVG